MKIPWFLRNSGPAILGGFYLFVPIQPAYAIDYLPLLTVNPPETLLEQLINNPQILEEEDLSIAHERSITDVLQGYPGLSSSKIGGFGQVGALFMRGAGGQGLVTLDDIPLLLSIPGFFNLDTLPIEAIETAEIERGPGAAFYPFQSLGGAIRLYTQDRPDTGCWLSVEGGSFGILRETLQGGVAGSAGRLTATLSRGDAFDGAHLANAANNPEREPSHFTQGILRFSSDLTARLSWQGSMLYRNSGVGTDKFGIDDQGRIALQDESNSNAKEETWLAQNSLNYQVSSDWNSRLQLGFTQLATEVNAGPLQNGMLTRLFLANWRNQHTLIENDKQKMQWQIIWGAQGRQEQGTSSSTSFNQFLPASFSQERTSTAGFIDTQARYGNLSGEAGVRVEHFDRYGDRPLFKAATAWHVTSELMLRASGGTGYRLPSYTELLFLFFSNPGLKPERSASGDLGIEWHPISGMRISAKGFYQRFDDLITPAYEPRRGPITLNVADADIAGLEWDAQYAWTDYFETGVSYTFSESHDLNTDKRLPFRPPHSARIWGKHKLVQLPVTLWAETVIRSATWNDSTNTLPVDESIQVNAAIRYAVSSRAEVYLRGENLANNHTPQIYSTDMPGIAVYGGFQLDF
ncbi:MAG: TonB-dependent receptor plug domain-containing protein [Methylosarcina sp.]